LGQSNFKISRPDTTQLPNQLKYEGNIKDAIQWKDRSGKHILIISETGIYQNQRFSHQKDGSDAELFAYHYKLSKQGVARVWKLYDVIADCPVDIELAFIENTLQLSDLNHDGVAEIWLMYKKVCHGDVSPADMRIILYQGNKKHIMNGQNKVLTRIDDQGKKHYTGGTFSFDRAFKQAPKIYRTFAQKLWLANIDGS
jgi:hypothetical protein